MPLIALTGGPGSGKTTVIGALRERGYDCVTESGPNHHSGTTEERPYRASNCA